MFPVPFIHVCKQLPQKASPILWHVCTKPQTRNPKPQHYALILRKLLKPRVCSSCYCVSKRLNELCLLLRCLPVCYTPVFLCSQGVPRDPQRAPCEGQLYVEEGFCTGGCTRRPALLYLARPKAQPNFSADSDLYHLSCCSYYNTSTINNLNTSKMANFILENHNINNHICIAIITLHQGPSSTSRLHDGAGARGAAPSPEDFCLSLPGLHHIVVLGISHGCTWVKGHVGYHQSGGRRNVNSVRRCGMPGGGSHFPDPVLAQSQDSLENLELWTSWKCCIVQQLAKKPGPSQKQGAACKEHDGHASKS